MSTQNLSGAEFLRYGAAFNLAGSRDKGVPVSLTTKISLGAPITADADGISASQAVTVGTTPLALINGALATSGAVTLDVPRAVVAAWTGASVLTVTGKDVYGQTMVESSASGTSLTGKKAFKTVTACSFSADVSAATIGTGNVLGLPYKLASKVDLLASFVDETADAGTTVVAVTTDPATAVTGDVRGTYTPASAPNGTKVYKLRAEFTPTTKASLYGVTNFAG